MIRIVLADDQALLRAGLRSVLAAQEDFTVVGEASDGAQAARTAQALDADLVLMDIQMPGVDGIEGVNRIVAAGLRAKVLMLTMFDLDEYVYGALRAGASGFLLKSAQPDEIVSAVREVHEGSLLFAPTVTQRLVEAYVRTPPQTEGVPPALADLTERELDVVSGIARGLSNAEIGAELFLGETTVKAHVSHILGKLGLRDRVQVVVLAYESGFAGR
ncbi:response regulator transcription factor [Ornithinimicrobium ciconiae]|uniref:Response regulator transcription factor n=1 Tax=Ornithinimicrobium ciconiae TaxID=2594265 RepID=A0A516GEW3_9MICO|nr:response regulator transcription factor [Ornithinimicrobium ciconiae]QDO90038.1 response regulator transcription factor [Ornithinimicrobium ciconiae]